MIDEVDEGLRLLLAGKGLPGDGVDLVFDTPTKEWVTARTGPTVNVFLYDLQEDLTRRRGGLHEVEDADGTVTGRRPPPRWYQLSYLVTAWTSHPQDEHRLLAQVLRGLSRTEVLDGDVLTGSLAELGLSLEMVAAGPISGGGAATELWTALGWFKAGISVQVTAPMASDLEPAGPPVTEGLLVRTADRAHDPAGPGRRLRYEDPAAQARGDGFAMVRARPAARRRGESS